MYARLLEVLDRLPAAFKRALSEDVAAPDGPERSNLDWQNDLAWHRWQLWVHAVPELAERVGRYAELCLPAGVAGT